MVFVRISSIVLAVVALLVIISVLKRALFGAPIKGMVEIVQYSVMFSIIIALPRTTLLGIHTRVTMLTESLPTKGQQILDFVVKLLTLGMFCFLCYMLVVEVRDAVDSKQVTEIFKIPFTAIYGVLACGVALNVIVVIYQTIDSFLSIFKKTEPALEGGADKEEK